jgi:hypothetical protein
MRKAFIVLGLLALLVVVEQSGIIAFYRVKTQSIIRHGDTVKTVNSTRTQYPVYGIQPGFRQMETGGMETSAVRKETLSIDYPIWRWVPLFKCGTTTITWRRSLQNADGTSVDRETVASVHQLVWGMMSSKQYERLVIDDFYNYRQGVYRDEKKRQRR